MSKFWDIRTLLNLKYSITLRGEAQEIQKRFREGVCDCRDKAKSLGWSLAIQNYEFQYLLSLLKTHLQTTEMPLSLHGH